MRSAASTSPGSVMRISIERRPETTGIFVRTCGPTIRLKAPSVPVISSDVDGAVGVLGEDYPGYFPVGDTEALRHRLVRAETDPVFLEQLERYVDRQAPLFGREREKARWAELLATLGSEGDDT